MTSAPVTEPRPSAPDMVRDTWYHGADIAALFAGVVHQQWLDRDARVHKHRIVDALLLLAVEHADQLPAYLDKLDERRSRVRESTSELGQRVAAPIGVGCGRTCRAGGHGC